MRENSAACRVFTCHILYRLASALVCLCPLLLSCGREKPAAPSPPVVEVAEVVRKDIPVRHEWVGITDGMVNAVIRAQVTGYLAKQLYKEGDPVKKGQLLFEIDPRSFLASLDQAKGNLAQQEAQHENAKANLERVRPLAAVNALSKKDLDDAISAERTTGSAVIAANAAVEKARLDLGFTKITSPIDGVAGFARAQVGDLVGPAQTGELTTVSKIDPIKAYFNVSEQAYIDAIKQFTSEGAVLRRAKKLALELILANGTLFPHKGRFYALDRQVSLGTGTLRVAGLFPNPVNLLRPGQFIKVRALVGIKKSALLVPQRAVTELQGTHQVAVVGPRNTVDIRTVQTGERVANLWVIDKGLNPGERVVAEGSQKIRQGMQVTPKPFTPPSADRRK